jgi:hypothetical protein
MFDRPWPMNSWLASTRWPDFSATDREIATASVRARMETMAAGKIVAPRACGERSGRESGGSDAGSAPTVRIALSSSGIRWSMRTATTLPATIAKIMYGSLWASFFAMMPTTRVTMLTVSTHGSTASTLLPRWMRISWNLASRGMSRPKKFFTWLPAMSRAAPAVNPRITVWEMKLTSVPSRAMPMTSWMTPVRSVIVRTSPMKAGVPGSARGLIEA